MGKLRLQFGDICYSAVGNENAAPDRGPASAFELIEWFRARHVPEGLPDGDVGFAHYGDGQRNRLRSIASAIARWPAMFGCRKSAW